MEHEADDDVDVGKELDDLRAHGSPIGDPGAPGAADELGTQAEDKGETAAQVLLFRNWQRLIHRMSNCSGRSSPTHFRYSRWGTQRRRWLDHGHYFDLNAPKSNPELPSLRSGDFEVQLYHEYGKTEERKGNKRIYLMTQVSMNPSQRNMQLRVQFVSRPRKRGTPRAPALLETSPLHQQRQDGAALLLRAERAEGERDAALAEAERLRQEIAHIRRNPH